MDAAVLVGICQNTGVAYDQRLHFVPGIPMIDGPLTSSSLFTVLHQANHPLTHILSTLTPPEEYTLCRSSVPEDSFSDEYSLPEFGFREWCSLPEAAQDDRPLVPAKRKHIRTLRFCARRGVPDPKPLYILYVRKHGNPGNVTVE